MTKQGLRGFAGGLIVATLLLSYVYFYHSDKSATRTITKADIETYAEKNDLVFITKEEYNHLTKQNDAKSKPEKPKEEEEKDKAKDKAKDKNQTQTAENKANEEEKKKENQQKQEKPITVQLEIKPGMSTSEVGEELQRLKLISNKSEFTNYIKKQKLESSVKAGSYKLNSDMTVEEIAAVLTK